MSAITKNIKNILKDIDEYSVYPEKVKLIAVTKYPNVNDQELTEPLENKIFSFGENKVQSLEAKRNNFNNEKKHLIKWNFIGNLQRNKVKYIIDYIEMIHSVNKLSLALEIDKRAEAAKRKIDVLIEFNLSEEESKEGYNLKNFYNEVEELLKLENINICGLMTMAANTEDEVLIRTCFRNLKLLKDELNLKYFNDKLTELSMGMSNDYKIALEEGATIIRIGTNLYKEN